MNYCNIPLDACVLGLLSTKTSCVMKIMKTFEIVGDNKFLLYQYYICDWRMFTIESIYIEHPTSILTGTFTWSSPQLNPRSVLFHFRHNVLGQITLYLYRYLGNDFVDVWVLPHEKKESSTYAMFSLTDLSQQLTLLVGSIIWYFFTVSSLAVKQTNHLYINFCV